MYSFSVAQIKRSIVLNIVAILLDLEEWGYVFNISVYQPFQHLITKILNCKKITNWSWKWN